jgi:primosomal protein N' (replication factor Y) (superfamily II helicase)
MDGLNNKYAVVLVNIKGLGVKTFSYLIPDEIKSEIKIGQAVLVPFGRQGLINAFIVGFSNYLPSDIKAKKINKILNPNPLFSLDYLKTLEWVANYYCCDFVTVLNMAIPMKLIDKNSKTENVIELSGKKDLGKLTKRQSEILSNLQNTGKINLIDFENKFKTTRATIKKLEKLGYIRILEEEVYRNPLSIFKNEEKEPLFDLSKEQFEIYSAIKKQIKQNKSPAISPLLLHGITASGKTEIYFKLIQDTINSGKNVLFLAPEIALASQLTKRLARKFPTDDIAIWHSSISDGERYDVWKRLYKNEIKILAGVRSAVFAPLDNIGLIIIDEEHESAYKQTSPNPRYDARLIARKLAEFHNCPLLLGSATPDIASYYRAKNSDCLFELTKRFNNAKVAETFVINMQNNFQQAYKNVISIPLREAIKETLEKGEQVILLMNRRGFSTSTQCLSCGEVIECEKCAIPMIWHSSENRLKCHYCGNTKPFPETCPKCESPLLKNTGTGTQKIEILINEMFPDAAIERVDSDVLSKKNEIIKILDRFQSGKIDILIGTQMIAKGLDNPNVTLVGVISADSSFNLPDFRATERGFQLLTQVAGRSGRGKSLGNVIFQTYNPDFYALNSAKAQNYNEFYETEIQAREEFDYPPFSQIIRLVISGENKFRAEKAAQEIALRLNTVIDKQGVSEKLIINGPSTCIIEKLKNNFRFQILIKNKLETKGHDFISSFLTKITIPKDLKMTIDVDPIDIL